jgi:hypothetical protein
VTTLIGRISPTTKRSQLDIFSLYKSKLPGAQLASSLRQADWVGVVFRFLFGCGWFWLGFGAPVGIWLRE